MSKLYVFGDSNSAHSNNNVEKIWSFILAQKLKVSEYINDSEFGISNENITSRFLHHVSNITDNDYVIFIVTAKSRKWFFYNHPHLTNFGNGEFDIIKEYYSKDEVNAVKSYYKYLDNSEVTEIQLRWLYGFLNHMQSEFNILIIPGFDNNFYLDSLYTTVGNLFPIGYNEYLDNDTREYVFRKKWKCIDKKINHISEDNHNILAEKVYQTFTNKKPLDLTSGFKEKIITKDNYQNFETIDETLIHRRK